MLQSLIQAVGGIGVFLLRMLGMLVMTDGLQGLTGARISQWLADATRSPWSGATTGANNSAILQSSSATTVAADALQSGISGSRSNRGQYQLPNFRGMQVVELAMRRRSLPGEGGLQNL